MDPGQYLSLPKRIKIDAEFAKGLVYIHWKELVHHNINYSNVLLCDDGIAKRTDIRLQHCDYTDPFTLSLGHHPLEGNLYGVHGISGGYAYTIFRYAARRN